MRAALALFAAGLAAACQAPARDADPAPVATQAIAATSDSPPETFDLSRIAGAWRPYSDGADQEFGQLEITADRVTFSRLGTATMAVKGRFGLLTWTQFQPAARDLCGEAPPPLVEFRIIPKATILAEGTPGEWLEVSFYKSVEAISANRETTTDLCRISTWDR